MCAEPQRISFVRDAIHNNMLYYSHTAHADLYLRVPRHDLRHEDDVFRCFTTIMPDIF